MTRVLQSDLVSRDPLGAPRGPDQEEDVGHHLIVKHHRVPGVGGGGTDWSLRKKVAVGGLLALGCIQIDIGDGPTPQPLH